MLLIKRLAFWLVFLFAAVSAEAAITPWDFPVNIAVSNSLTVAAICCNLQVGGAQGFNVLLDGTSVGTSTITVAIQILDPNTSTYVTPATVNGVANPVTLTNGTAQLINIPGSVAGVQINVTSFGTATGTFVGSISAY